MTKFPIPKNYKPALKVREIETAIKLIKEHFERSLVTCLRLQRISAPMFLDPATGLNDNLNGTEKPVSFYATGIGKTVEIVQSLAKWKRYALHKYGFKPGEGLYTDMNAIRPDETITPIHSFYVDQWDWCKVMRKNQRNLPFLKSTVKSIFAAIQSTERWVCSQYPQIKPILPDKITFITSEELLYRYPKLTPKERETEFCREAGAIFVIGIGGKLSNGTIHDGRAPDYDDWSSPHSDGVGLNGDILLWHPTLQTALEVSSMGIRVDAYMLKRQLNIRQCEDRAKLPFHKSILNGELPQTIGGGIGQSRLALFMLRAVHIGEVACGLWTPEMVRAYKKAGITLL